MDLSKAFNIVDHSILLSKLCFYGIRGIPFNLLKDNLHNRLKYTMFKYSITDFLL